MNFLAVCTVILLGNSVGNAAAATDPRGMANPLPASFEHKVPDYWGQDASASSFKSLSLWVDLIGQYCLGNDGPPAPQVSE